jgi:hypothetical protein
MNRMPALSTDIEKQVRQPALKWTAATLDRHAMVLLGGSGGREIDAAVEATICRSARPQPLATTSSSAVSCVAGSPSPPPFFSSMNSTLITSSVGALIHGFSACIHRGRDSSADGAGAFLDALSHQLLLAGLRRFRRAVFRREPKPDAGRGAVCKLNTGRF